MQAGSQRTLRMRAPDFHSALVPGAQTRMALPPRASFAEGERIRVEISFGPLADEIDLYGVVNGEGADDAALELDRACAAQLAYVLDVLGGQREAAARRHRRLASSLPVRWEDASRTVTSRLADISAGGAFIAAEDLPRVGTPVTVQLHTGDVRAPLRLDAVVTWVRQSRDMRRGFGVAFRPEDAECASRIKALVREHEAEAPSGGQTLASSRA